MPLATTKTTTTTSTPLGSYSSSLNTAIPAHASHIRSLAQDKYTLDEECEALQRAIEGSKRAQERARREYELKTAGRVSESGRWARVMGPNEQPIGGRARATGNKENEGMIHGLSPVKSPKFNIPTVPTPAFTSPNSSRAGSRTMIPRTSSTASTASWFSAIKRNISATSLTRPGSNTSSIFRAFAARDASSVRSTVQKKRVEVIDVFVVPADG